MFLFISFLYVLFSSFFHCRRFHPLSSIWITSSTKRIVFVEPTSVFHHIHNSIAPEYTLHTVHTQFASFSVLFLKLRNVNSIRYPSAFFACTNFETITLITTCHLVACNLVKNGFRQPHRKMING